MLLRINAVAVCLAGSLGCGVLTTTTKLPPAPSFQTATKQELLDKIQRIASVQSMKAGIEVTLTVQSNERDKEIEYRNVSGALVSRRPALIRTNAETPGGIAVIYDMASDGEVFQVHVPWQNRVLEGRTALSRISENRWENIRPQHMLDALMLEPVEHGFRTLLDFNMYGRSGYQVLHEVEESEDGDWRIRRKFWFSRSDLTLSRLMILDDGAELVTDAWYRGWLEDNGLPYPRYIKIERPKDGYRLEIEITKPGLNESVPDESFQLNLPNGTVVERIGEESGSSSNS